jgi:ATP-dependent helicase/nuclease subunit A
MYLHERATQFGTFQRQGLGRFMQFLDNLRAEADLGLPSVATEAENVVRIMSVHRSKGLEFPVVILPDLGKLINLQDCRGHILLDREAGLGMSVVDEEKRIRYPSLALTLVQERLRRQAMDEELRVLYVAMTRAKEHLILAGTCAETAAEVWSALWSSHHGPLPADSIIGARSMLDWLGPVASCASGAAGEIMRIHPHDSAEVASWTAAPSEKLADGALERLARLEPLDPAPAPHPLAEQVISRLSFVYPHQAMANQRAVRAMTETHSSIKVFSHGAAGSSSLPLPRFLDSGSAARPLEIGAATHLVLEHLDFPRAQTEADLSRQMDELVARRLLSAAHAAIVDRAAIAWFLRTPLGATLRENASRLLRELPLYLAAAPEGASEIADPMDQVMLRGRLDLLLVLPDHALLIDFKTDALAEHEVDARAEEYLQQLQHYRAALSKMLGAKPIRTSLVFLHARTIREMNGI